MLEFIGRLCTSEDCVYKLSVWRNLYGEVPRGSVGGGGTCGVCSEEARIVL